MPLVVILNPINIIGPYDINNWTRQFIKPVYNDKLEVERQLGKKHSNHVQSKYVLKFLTVILGLKSKIDGKEPALTPAKYIRAIGSITCNYNKATEVLNYKTSSLSKMVKDSCDWLRKESLL